MNNRKKGDRSEALASQFLEAKGYLILKRNYRYGRNEIDIIASRNDLLLFVEVKSRKNTSYGYPEEFVSEKQIERIQEAAEEYIYATNWKGRIRFDIISVTGDGQITHFEDALS